MDEPVFTDEAGFMGGADLGDDVVFASGAASADEGEFSDEVVFADEAGFSGEVGLSDAVAFPIVLPGGAGFAGGADPGDEAAFSGASSPADPFRLAAVPSPGGATSPASASSFADSTSSMSAISPVSALSPASAISPAGPPRLFRRRARGGDEPVDRLEDTGLSAADREILADAGLAVGAPMGRIGPDGPRVLRGLDGDGRDVVVHLLDVPEDGGGARTLRRLAELRALRHPALARVREVISLPGDRAVVTVDLVPGADLAVVLGARGCLTRSEAARLLDDVGSALARLHEAGLAHGDVSSANVVITTEGGAVLIDLFGGVMETGTGRWAAPERAGGGPATPASDVYSLGALLRSCATGTAVLGERLDRVLADVLVDDPARRPTARALAARAPEVGAPGVIELPDGARLAAGALRAAAAVPTRQIGSRRGGRRLPAFRGGRLAARAAAVLGALVLVGALAVLGPWPRLRQAIGSVLPGGAAPAAPVASAAESGATAGTAGGAEAAGAAAASESAASADPAGPTAPSGPAAPADPTDSATPADSADLVAVVTSLSSARDGALETGDPAALAATTVPGSPAAQADEEMLTALRDSGETVSDLETSVSGVEEVAVPADCAARWPDAVAVRLSRAQQPSTRTAADGTSRTVPAQASHEIILILVPDPWRVAEVLPAEQ